MFSGPLQDCARVFPLKGARDALRNLEAGVNAIDRSGFSTEAKMPDISDGSA